MIHRKDYFEDSSPFIQSSIEKVRTTHNYEVEITDLNDKIKITIMIITA